MIIVAGWLRVDAAAREEYVLSCRSVVQAARLTRGCIDFCVSADLIEPDRVNVFERWETADAVEGFRGSGPSAEQHSVINAASVIQYEVAESITLTG